MARDVSVQAQGVGSVIVWTHHVMTLSAIGLALTPAGGSVCMRLKSRISRRLAAVDIFLRSSGSSSTSEQSSRCLWSFCGKRRLGERLVGSGEYGLSRRRLRRWRWVAVSRCVIKGLLTIAPASRFTDIMDTARLSIPSKASSVSWVITAQKR